MQHISFHLAAASAAGYAVNTRPHPAAGARLHLRGGGSQLPRGLLIDPGAGYTHGKVAHALNDADPLGNADGTASIEQIEQVRTLQAKIIGRKQRKTAALLRGEPGLRPLRSSSGRASFFFFGSVVAAAYSLTSAWHSAS